MNGSMKALAIAGAVATTLIVPATSHATTDDGLFASREKKSSRMEAFQKWNGVVRRHYRELRIGARHPALRRWRAFIDRTRRLPRLAQLRAVQRFVNGFGYISDLNNYGQEDYWATPRQFFARGGDCEDFAFVKYMTLKALGWRLGNLRLVILMDRRLGRGHAVLAVRIQGRHYILDNRIRHVVRDIQIRHYRPVYSINENHWWRHL